MRFTSSLLVAASVLTGVAQAQDAQKPLYESWFEKAKSYVASGIPSPSEAGAAVVADAVITDLTSANWQQVLRARPGKGSPQNWMIQVTGGNKTCGGRCAGLDANFNKTAALLSATPGGPSLARINCEYNSRLCSTLFTAPPVLWYVQIPGVQAEDQTRAPTPIYIRGLNTTEPTSVQEMVDFHSKKTYLERPPVTNSVHPFDGIVAQYGLLIPVGAAFWVFSAIPSWGMMLVVSFVTRTLIGQRMANKNQADIHTARARAAGAGGAPAGGAAAKKAN